MAVAVSFHVYEKGVDFQETYYSCRPWIIERVAWAGQTQCLGS